jgi:hypothetical protein
MKAWSSADLKIVDDTHTKLGSEVLGMIQEHNILKALTTNARSAWFLLKAAEGIIKNDKKNEKYFCRDRIRQQIVEFAPDILRQVVNSYISANGIANLDVLQRRRVAAYIFDALETTTRNKSMIIPDFENLDFKEKTVALSLISNNIESYSDNTQTLIRNEVRSISVSPAITIILFWMCDVSIGVSLKMSLNWKMQELLSALFEFRYQLRQCIKQYNNECNLDLFQHELMLVRIIHLQKRVPGSNAKVNLLVPYVDKHTIWINGDMAPYADVVAPYTLYQCKNSVSSGTRINLEVELEKCGLLKESKENRNKIGWAVTKSLEILWNMNIYYNRETTPVTSSVDDTKKNSRYFYPDKQLAGPSLELIEYADLIEEANGDWFLKVPDGKKEKIKVLIEQDLSKELVYTISCNQNEIILTRNKTKDTLRILSDYLDDDGYIQEGSLSSQDQTKWEYYKNLLKEKVIIRFLLS